MQKVLVIVSSNSLVYGLDPGMTSESTAASAGVTDPALYQEFAESDFDLACYNFPGSFTLAAGVVGFDLPTAKTQASSTVKSQTATEQQSALAGYTSEVLASQAILPELSRTPEIQSVLESVNDLNTALQSELAAITAATGINEVNNIVNKPTGILDTGRGSGLGPLDLNVSYYTEFNSASMDESETELFVPGTSTVIAYGSGYGGQGFDSSGNCFAPGDFLLQIRETATGSVIAEFECPLNPAGENVAF